VKSDADNVSGIIPSKIAYGEAGYGAIAPYTPLIFDLNLVEVKKQ
jgi:FKBP-type peptidyl-prolyl cis-trans isomerase